MSKLIAGLCGAGIVASTVLFPVAQAQVASADVDMFNISFRLTDLDLTDGITPSITITPLVPSSPIRTSYSMYDDGVQAVYERLDDIGATDLSNAFGAASTSTGVDFMRASARYEGNRPGLTVFGGSSEYRFGFELTPSTSFAFSADLTYSAMDPDAEIRASSAVSILGFFLEPAPGQADYVAFQYEKLVQDGNFADQFYGELRSSNESLLGYFNMRAGAGVVANDSASPVPEPATYAMLFSGLVLVGARARMRSASARA